MNELKIFENEQFGEVRTMSIENTPYFVGKDIGEILGYDRPDKALDKHVDDEDKLMVQIGTSGQNRNMYVINESGLYSLILSSKMPKAKEFKRWVTSEVLPSIRKNGAYMTGETLEKALTSPDFLIDLATKLKEEQEQRKQLEERVKQDKPKVLFAESVETASNSCLVGELAKLISQNGHEIGQNRLFTWLRSNGYLIKRKGENYNLPSQYSMDLGLMEIKKRSINNPDGTVRTTSTTKITGKGQIYFINKFIGKEIA